MSSFASRLTLLPLLAACAVSHVQRGAPLAQHGPWVLLPVQNLAETPLAGERAEAILATLLRARGLGLTRPPDQGNEGDLPDLDEHHRLAAASQWAKSQGFAYGVSGSVTEWRYRQTRDGEPAVGMALEVTNLKTGVVVWSASGSLSGWGHETVSGTAEKLLGNLVSSLELR